MLKICPNFNTWHGEHRCRRPQDDKCTVTTQCRDRVKQIPSPKVTWPYIEKLIKERNAKETSDHRSGSFSVTGPKLSTSPQKGQPRSMRVFKKGHYPKGGSPRSYSHSRSEEAYHKIVEGFVPPDVIYRQYSEPMVVWSRSLSRVGGDPTARVNGKYTTFTSYQTRTEEWRTPIYTFGRREAHWYYPSGSTEPAVVYSQSSSSGTCPRNDVAHPANGDYLAAHSRAQKQLVERLSDLRNSGWNAAISIAESAETWRLFRGTAITLAKVYSGLRRGDPRALNALLHDRNVDPARLRRIKAPKGASKGWAERTMLEYNLAWAPLIGDVHSAAEYLAKKIISKRPTLTMTVRGKGVGRSLEKIPYGLGPASNTALPGENSGTILSQLVENVSFSLKVRPLFSFEPSTLEQCGFYDISSIVWELVPLSFLVDYLINVGDVLSSMHELSYWDYVDGVEGRLKVLEQTGSFNYTYAGTSGGNIPTAGGFTRKLVTASRSPWSPPNGTINLSYVDRRDASGEKRPWSKTHVANVLSILSLAFR